MANKFVNKDLKDTVDRTVDEKVGTYLKDKKNQYRGKFKKKGRRGDSNIRKGKMFNDISHYMKNPSITEAFARFPYSFIVGSRIPGLQGPSSFVTNLEFTVLTSFIVDWVCSDTSVSELDDPNYQSILDQVKTIIYTAMRRANSGSTNNIEPIDVLVSNLIATIDILCNAVYIATFFKIVNTFSWKNRLLPKTIFDVRGVDYDDFVDNLANYRGRYDVLVAKAKTIRTLSNFPLVNVAMAEYANIFKDQDTDTGREQLIIPVKAFHHIYDSKGSDNHPGGMVRLMHMNDLIGGDPNKKQTVFTAGKAGFERSEYIFKFDVLLNILEAQINALVNDADFNLIQADIEKAFGEQSGYFEVDSISNSADPMNITYSEEFLQMYHNANMLVLPGISGVADEDKEKTGLKKGLDFGKYVNSVYQIPNNTEDPEFTKFGVETHVKFDGSEMNALSLPLWCDNTNEDSESSPEIPYIGGLVDTDLNDPSPEQNVIMTRYKHVLTQTSAEGVPSDFQVEGGFSDDTYLRTKGSSCFMLFNWQNVTIRYFSNGATPEIYSIKSPVQLIHTNHPVLGFTPSMFEFATNHRPWILATNSNGELSPRVWVPLFGLNNVRLFSPIELANINLACFLSLWDLPSKTNI